MAKSAVVVRVPSGTAALARHQAAACLRWRGPCATYRQPELFSRWEKWLGRLHRRRVKILNLLAIPVREAAGNDLSSGGAPGRITLHGTTESQQSAKMIATGDASLRLQSEWKSIGGSIIRACLILALLTCLPSAWGAIGVTTTVSSAGPNGVELSWNVIPDRIYRLQSATDISGPWQDALPAPGTLTATTNYLSRTIATDSVPRFYRVLLVDTVGPEVYRVEPMANGFAVGRQAALRAWLRDDSGITTNSLRLTIQNRPPIGFGDPRLQFSGGILTYQPAPNEFLGAPGDVVSVSLAAADVLGNQTTNFKWSFQLELPVVQSPNLVFIGGGTNSRSARGIPALAAPLNSTLTLVATNGNLFTYSFTGASSGLAVGQFLVNTNLANGYTRAVVNFIESPIDKTVIVVTRPAKLAELLQQGSLSSASLVEIHNPLKGTQSLWKQLDLSFAKSLDLNFNYDLAQTVYKDAVLTVELLPGSFLNLTGALDFNLNVRDFHIREFETKATGIADFRLEARATVSGAVDRAPTIALIKPIHQHYGGFIGPVPVWVEVVYEINLGCDLHLDAQASYAEGLSGAKEIRVGRRYTEAEGWTASFENPAAGFAALGPTWQIETTGNVRVYVQPKVTAYVELVAGVSLDLQPYFDLSGRAQVNPREWELALYGGLSSTIGLDLRGWDDAWGELPKVSFDLIPRTLLWYTNALAGAPKITLQPQPQLVRLNDTALFIVEAVGETPLSYRWFKDGRLLGDDFLISGSQTPCLRVRNVKAYDQGDYQVEVSNLRGRKLSNPAKLQIYFDPEPPVNMALIPAGSFQMGDTFSEGSSDEGPLHSVFVAAFYMDKYEVTKALWDEVQGWSGGNGYGFDNPGAAKAANHPVQSVSWYDMVKWCNARSQKEGRVSAYYTDPALTQIYKTGRVVPYVKWDEGYRLPTEAEWEKAARGGADGHRFPWSEVDTITHNRANYGSSSFYLYDVSPTHGFHPAYDDGLYPYTSPVGSFATNGYGLNDMAGNVWEWCWDWYGSYPSGSQRDPRGPASGSYRVIRGGGWGDFAFGCRSAIRGSVYPEYRRDYLGFRSVLPPGQP